MAATKNVIVFPTDFSLRSLDALPWVERMQASLDAQVHCIFVVQDPSAFASLEMGSMLPMPTLAELVKGVEPSMTEFARKHLGGLRQPVAKVLGGQPADTVVDYAKDNGATLIIMTTHGHTGLKHALLGSTAEAVLRRASCPVLSVRIK